MLALGLAQVAGDVALERGLGGAEEMVEQDVFGRNRRVRLELEQPVPVGVLAAEQRVARPRDRGIEVGHSPALRRFAAAKPERIAPSIVAGKPVST